MKKAAPANNYLYNKSLKELARANRKNMTKSATCMWKYVLSKKQMLGFEFRRERPILNYIADFACLELLLVIEIDGITHDDELKMDSDLKRDRTLKSIGFTTLRFSSWEVLNRIDDVSNKILEWIKENHKEG